MAVPAVVLMIAAVLRVWGLPSPPTPYGDEPYYVFDAEAYLGGGVEQPIEPAPPVRIADEGTWVHPPLGKWIIALLGVGPIGLRSIGWRLPSALFGVLGVALVYFLALRLWGSVWWAGFASLLLALDGLHIVESRIAMLDIFLSTFVTAGILFVVLDRQREPAGRPRWSRTKWLFGSPFRLWAGIFFGAAVATKWSGLFALLLGAALCTSWSLTGGRQGERSVAATIGTIIMSFALVPLGVYLLSYGSFFYQHGFAIRDFLTLQLRMLQYQQSHVKVQPENSAPWTWPLLLHPVLYFKVVGGTLSRTIVALGNPALWWGFLALLPFAAAGIVRRAAWQDAVTFGTYAAMYLPWFAIGRSQFIWYLLPAIPFLCLCVTSTIRRAPTRTARAGAIMFLVATALAAVAFAPVWTGWSVPSSWIRGLRWLPGWWS